MAGLLLDPTTRDLVLDGDSVQVTHDPRTEILLAIGVALDSFHGDPDQGSAVPALIEGGSPPVDARRAVETAAQAALQRLEDLGLVEVRHALYDPVTQTLTIDTDALTGLELDLG